MFVTDKEIFTHLYPEQVYAIQGDEKEMLELSLDAAVMEAKGYLHRYDTDKVFGATGTDRHSLLLVFVKDIAVWHYLNIANPGTELAHRERRYAAAIAWLRGVQKGTIAADMPPAEPEDGSGNNTDFKISSNPKRNNYI